MGVNTRSAIVFTGVSKRYALGTVTRRTLKRDVQRFWDMRVLHRVDPYMDIMKGIKTGIVGQLDFQKSDDESIVWSSRSDDLNQGLVLLNGLSTLCVTVPPRTLGKGDYTLSISFTERGIHRPLPLANAHTILTIALHDYTTTLGDTRQGYLSTLLDWHLLQ